MQRLPKDFSQDLYGNKMLLDFSTTVAEEEVESYYQHYYEYTSIFKMTTIKKCLKKDSKGSGGKTDGLIECNYKGKFFYGIQETKYKLPDTELQLKKQLVQPMMYDWIFERKGFYYDTQFYMLTSEKYVSVIYSEEIEEFKRKLWNVYPVITESPCNAYKNPLVRKIMDETNIDFRKQLITDKFKLHEVVRDIFKHCLK